MNNPSLIIWLTLGIGLVLFVGMDPIDAILAIFAIGLAGVFIMLIAMGIFTAISEWREGARNDRKTD